MNASERRFAAGRRWLALAGLAALLLLALALLPPAQVARGKYSPLPAATEASPSQQQAGALSLADARVQSHLGAHRSEVLAVEPLGAGRTPASLACALSDCRLVEIYDYDSDATVSAIVDLPAGPVRDVLYQPHLHPLPNARLSALAVQVALASPEFIQQLGRVPAAAELAPMPSGVPGTACASGHMCLAVTAPAAHSLVWAIVDVTHGSLVAVLNTPLPAEAAGSDFAAPAAAPTSCPDPGSVTRGGWSLSYETTSSDGFRVYDAAYLGVPVLTSAKIVEWHTDYGSSGFVDEPGCGNYIAPHGQTQVNDLLSGADVVGFEVVQDFRMSSWGAICNYRYEQHDQFYNDGRFRIVGQAFGRGCSTSGIYRPIMRLDLNLDGAGTDSFDEWDDAAWQRSATENWWSQAAPYTPEGYKWRVNDQQGRGYFIEPGQGQFGDGGRGDFAFLYATQHHPEEGDTDLGEVGFCCEDDFHQGPDQFLNGESITNQHLVLWYVPQMQTTVGAGNNYCWTVAGEPSPETYPCASGPLFVPMTLTAGFVDDAPRAVGAGVTFTSTSGGLGPLAFKWNFGDGLGSSTAPHPSYTYSVPGTYTVSLTITDTSGTQSAAHPVIVAYPPLADFALSRSTTISNTIVLSNTSSGSAPLSYQWDFGDGSTSTETAPSHTYARTGLYTVTLTAANVLAANRTSQVVILPPILSYWPVYFR
jgi:hypothetical protein